PVSLASRRHSLFFFSYLAHRELHSFPTRRSSDLLRLVEGVAARREAAGRPVDEVHVPEHVIHRLRGANVRGPLADDQRHLRLAQDRKSTRLNSSHEWISYAVFCLKKKNHHDKVQV